MMPEVDGWQVLDRLRLDDRLARVPVVVITAFSRDLGTAAACPVLRKPIELGDLLSVTNRYCDARS
jgi:CheY-like chemotaxis protein